MRANSSTAIGAVFALLAIYAAQGQAAPTGPSSQPMINVSRGTDGVSVSALSAPQQLRGKMVEDQNGHELGRVRSVSVGREGKAEVVNIEVGGLMNLGTRIMPIMPISAERIIYIPSQARLVASLEPSGIKAPEIKARSPVRDSIRTAAPSQTIFQD